jgi:hypothetical protein
MRNEDDDDRLLVRPKLMPSHSRESWSREQASASIAHHVTMRLEDSGTIARTPAALRIASDITLRIGRKRGLLAHAFADNHFHGVLGGTREEAGVFARCVEGVLRKTLDIKVPFERCRIRPIRDPRHLRNVMPYVFKQAEHHGAAFDRLRDGSSLLDLLGLRVGSEWIVTRFATVLPRSQRTTMLDWLGAPDLDEVVPDAVFVPDAAAAALGIVSLHGNEAKHVRARRAAVQTLDLLAPGCDVATTLQISRRAVIRYRSQEAEPTVMRAVELQVKLRTLVAGRSDDTSVLLLPSPGG